MSVVDCVLLQPNRLEIKVHVVFNNPLILLSVRSAVAQWLSVYQSYQTLKCLKKGTCPASQKILEYIGKNIFHWKSSKFSFALQPQALINTSGRVDFSNPANMSVVL